MFANNKKWDTRFLGLASHISGWCKDPSSQVGAVITEGNRIVSMGYNGFAQGVKDTESRLNNRSIKYPLTIHAEENAFIFANRDLHGCTIYVTHPPCPICASKIAQHGISRVVHIAPSEDFLSRWEEQIELSAEVFNEKGIEVVSVNPSEITRENAHINPAPNGFITMILKQIVGLGS